MSILCDKLLVRLPVQDQDFHFNFKLKWSKELKGVKNHKCKNGARRMIKQPNKVAWQKLFSMWNIPGKQFKVGK